MEICFVSDLHEDYSSGEPIKWPLADVLVIGGDTANSEDRVLALVEEVASIYRNIVMVLGNHEHYSNALLKRTVDDTTKSINGRLPSNVYLLDHHMPTVTIDGVNFVGANGWYSCDAVGDPARNRAIWPHVDQGGINDCHNIGFHDILQPMPWDRAETDALLIRETIERVEANGLPIVVVTHTVPHRDMVILDPADFQWNSRNAYYVNMHCHRIIEEFGPRISVWYNGHMHSRRDKTINGVYCLSNPRGYGKYGEDTGWSPITIEV